MKNQDVFTRLLDLIPEAIDKIKNGAVSDEAIKKAEAYNEAAADDIEIINAE